MTHSGVVHRLAPTGKFCFIQKASGKDYTLTSVNFGSH